MPEQRPDPDAVTLLGVRLDKLTEDEAVRRVAGALSAGQGGWVATPNSDYLRQLKRRPDWLEVINDADLSLADGMPLVWACQARGTPLPARVAGSELIEAICAEMARLGRSVFLLGGPPGTAERAGQTLVSRFPGLDVHHLSPIVTSIDEVSLAPAEAALEQARPAVVFCAFGFFKQELLMHFLHPRHPSMWFVASGGTFSMLAGDTPKAPMWARRAGLEWAHRLRLEPRRLFARYVLHDLPFVVGLLVSSTWVRLRRPNSSKQDG